MFSINFDPPDTPWLIFNFQYMHSFCLKLWYSLVNLLFPVHALPLFETLFIIFTVKTYNKCCCPLFNGNIEHCVLVRACCWPQNRVRAEDILFSRSSFVCPSLKWSPQLCVSSWRIPQSTVSITSRQPSPKQQGPSGW